MSFCLRFIPQTIYFLNMPLTKEQKKEVIKDIKDSLEKQNILIFVNFLGLDVESISDLRGKLKKIGANMMVAKKTLTKLAFKELNIDLPKEATENELALIFGFQEQIPVAKLLYNFSKDNESLKLKSAYLREDKELDFINAEQLVEFAQLPSKEDLYTRLLGAMSAPISNFVNVQKQCIKGLFYALGAIINSH